MADQKYSLTQMNTLYQGLTILALGLPFVTNENKAAAYSAVRVSWPTTGQPAWKITDDIAVLSCIEGESDYNLIRQRVLSDNVGNDNLDQTIQYTRYWSVKWVLYGPNSYDNGGKIKSAMYKQLYRDALALKNVFLVPLETVPRRAPELFQSQWWERADLTMMFYENVIERDTVDYVAAAVFDLITDGGTEREFTVTAPQEA